MNQKSAFCVKKPVIKITSTFSSAKIRLFKKNHVRFAQLEY